MVIQSCLAQNGYSNEVLKARLVVQRFIQVPGIDHQDNFSPVIYETTLRIVFTMWAIFGWSGEIIDIETAFSYGVRKRNLFKDFRGVQAIQRSEFGRKMSTTATRDKWTGTGSSAVFLKIERSPRNRVRFQKVYERPMFVHKKG